MKRMRNLVAVLALAFAVTGCRIGPHVVLVGAGESFNADPPDIVAVYGLTALECKNAGGQTTFRLGANGSFRVCLDIDY